MTIKKKSALDVAYKIFIVIIAGAGVTTLAWSTIAAPKIKDQIQNEVTKCMTPSMTKNDADHMEIKKDIAELRDIMFFNMTKEQQQEYLSSRMNRRPRR
jgi:hypothetical protein